MSNAALFPSLVTTQPAEQIARVYGSPEVAQHVIQSSEQAQKAYRNACRAMGLGSSED